MDIAVVGGGLAGVFAARRLKEAGHRPFIIEKSRSVGGRMATRRMDGGKADHGAQFFTARSEAFKRMVHDWEKQGHVTPWFGEDHPRYRASFGMNQLVKHMAEDISVILQEKIIRVESEDFGLTLASEDGELYTADAAILTAPVPQTLEMLERSSLEIETHTSAALAAFHYDPCIAGLFHLKEPQAFGDHGLMDQSLPEGVAKAAANDQKGISEEPIVTVYMTAEWSKSHFENEDDDILQALQAAVSSIWTSDIHDVQLKKWRYSDALHVHHAPYYQLDSYPLYLAGDAFLYPDDEAGYTRVESAVLSGLAAAEALL
ncbi:NAD(P)/FAD-dependent oxidoreductase [Alkalicoccus chagannorensis]|uniref:NAD(P)/FAD-dependent oxidoreductase n=1 Tax=Alkalicoccus chagannorensis TaxID=427072 RepID=UPI00047AD4B2|nr:FAD-dependent oxidoreductase [Alkalicoccus chagannorensis]